MDYKEFTVNDLIEIVKNDEKNFPSGLDTIVASGDFEGNNSHIKHGIFFDSVTINGKKKSVIFLGYEMHERAL